MTLDRIAAIFDEVQYFVGVSIFLLGISGPVLKAYSAEHQMIVGLGLAILAHIRMQRARTQGRSGESAEQALEAMR